MTVRMPRRPLHTVILGLCLAAASTAGAQAQCPTGLFVLDLKSCASGVTNSLAGITVQSCAALAPSPAISTCPASAGWKEALVRIAIPSTCRQANVVVEYEGLPSQWTINLGDSPTNDGHAGDAGSTPNNAEVYVIDERLYLANAGNSPTVIDNPFVQQDVSLTDSSLKLAVRNQYVSWGQPHGFAQTPTTKKLFAIPDATVATAERRALYLGLNRVVAGRADRKGCGARRVMISFQ